MTYVIQVHCTNFDLKTYNTTTTTVVLKSTLQCTSDLTGQTWIYRFGS